MIDLRSARWAACLAFSTLCAGCPGPELPEVEPVFPADYASTYTEVRDCRRSPDHDLAYIRVLASPEALAAYTARDAAFPEGAVVLKEEFADPACADPTGWTAMRRQSAGYFAAGGDWQWQRVDPDRRVAEDGALPRCAGCHSACGVAPEGHDWTCAAP